ncbi:MAG TPA: proline--tRNA ligase, partial [Sphingobacteriaceae bacterium]|nr:proline--tRNA ligase [Sphingobacteriaceae bacterium]
ARNISVKYDDRDTQRPGFKFAEYELKGIPVRLAMGGRDLENGTIEIARRDTKEKQTISRENLDEHIENLLNEIQKNIYNKALNYRTENTTEVNSYEEFKQVLEGKGGFISAHWDGTSETEKQIKEETKATI